MPIIYDVTRLAARVWSQTPNGIDRIDFALASYFLTLERKASAAAVLTLFGPRMITQRQVQRMLTNLVRHWGEEKSASDEVLQKTIAWITHDTRGLSSVTRIRSRRRADACATLLWLRQFVQFRGRALKKAVPENTVYLNVSQFPLWIAFYFRWLMRRPDVKPVFFIHDLLPLQRPEYFRRAEYGRHRKRLKNLAAFGAGAIVASQATCVALQDHLATLGRADLPILVAPVPAAPIFSQPMIFASELAGRRYFVMCGTIEPRKNHLLLLQVWRELVRRDGADAPRLILVGARGWENENILDLLERCHEIGGHVLEVSGLSTPGLKRLLDQSCGLLMPSFAEGYGLPVAEALAANVPVIVSDIPAAAEFEGPGIIRISPIDGEKWLEAIRLLSRAEPAAPSDMNRKRKADEEWRNYFAQIEEFLAKLCANSSAGA